MKKLPRNPKPPKPPKDESYEVGYGRPPVASQFKPGKSPNPSGRPKGSKNKPVDVEAIEDLIFEEGARQMKISEGGRVNTISVAKGIVRPGSTSSSSTNSAIYPSLRPADNCSSI